MPETEYNGPGLQMSPEIFEVLQAGIDFADLQKTRGYTRLMDFLRGAATAKLKAMKDAPYAEDRVRLAMLLQWQFAEDVVRDVEFHMKDAIALGKSVAKDLNVSELAKEGFATRFDGLEDDE